MSRKRPLPQRTPTPARGPRISGITRPRARATVAVGKPLATVTATCLGPNLKSAPYASISLIQPVLLKFTRTIK